MKSLKKILMALTFTAASLSAFAQTDEKLTPVQKHGQLTVQDSYLVDENDDIVQLYGMSTHGIAWFPQYLNKDMFTQLRDDWNTNCVRIVMYTDENGGYCSGGNQEKLKEMVYKSVDMATELGLYVIVDWHVLHDETPEKYEDQAIKFFNEVSKRYRKNVNVLYEICNEPNGNTSWSDIYCYAEKVIPVIRKNSKNAIVLVGTPSWSSRIDDVVDMTLDFPNVMYDFHFYADSHKASYRSKVQSVLRSGIPVFVTEFGTCDASGNGGFNPKETQAWFDFLDENYVSYMNWGLANKNETACAIKSTVRKVKDLTYDDLSESGQLVYTKFRSMEQ